MRPLAHTIISILFVVTYITIPMRIWVRGVSMKSFGWDDWVMTSMLVRIDTGSRTPMHDAVDADFM